MTGADGITISLNENGYISEIEGLNIDYPAFLGDLNLRKFKHLKRFSFRALNGNLAFLTSIQFPDSMEYVYLLGNFTAKYIRFKASHIDTLSLVTGKVSAMSDTVLVKTLILEVDIPFRPSLGLHTEGGLKASNIVIITDSTHLDEDVRWIEKNHFVNKKINTSPYGIDRITITATPSLFID